MLESHIKKLQAERQNQNGNREESSGVSATLFVLFLHAVQHLLLHSVFVFMYKRINLYEFMLMMVISLSLVSYFLKYTKAWESTSMFSTLQ